MKHRHLVLRIASAIALAGVLVISPPIKVPTASALTVFSDDFSSAGFTNWTGVTGLTIDPGVGRVAPPSAKAQAVAAPAFAYKLLPTTLNTVCMSMNVNATSLGAGYVSPLRLRTAANGPIVRVFTTSAGILWVQVRCLGGPTELRRRPGDRVARHRAVRHGRNVRIVGPLP